MNLYTLCNTREPENHTRLDRIRVCPLPLPFRHLPQKTQFIAFDLQFDCFTADFLLLRLIFVIRFMRKIYHYRMTVGVADDRYYRYGGKNLCPFCFLFSRAREEGREGPISVAVSLVYNDEIQFF